MTPITSYDDLIALEIQQFSVDWMWNHDPELKGAPLDMRAMKQYAIEPALNELYRLTLQLPVQVLARDRVVAEYPTTLWQHIKKAIGLRYAYVRVTQNESLIYPHIAIPPGLKIGHRLFVETASRVLGPVTDID
jgi:glutathionylspermidine synthase